MVKVRCRRCKEVAQVNIFVLTFIFWRNDWCDKCEPTQLERGNWFTNSLRRISLRNRPKRKTGVPNDNSKTNSSTRVASESKPEQQCTIGNPINVKVPSQIVEHPKIESEVSTKGAEETLKHTWNKESEENKNQIEEPPKADHNVNEIKEESPKVKSTSSGLSSKSDGSNEHLNICDIQRSKPESLTYAVARVAENTLGSQVSLTELTNDEQVETLTVKQLRGILNKHNVDWRDCVERTDLVDKVIELRAQ